LNEYYWMFITACWMFCTAEFSVENSSWCVTHACMWLVAVYDLSSSYITADIQSVAISVSKEWNNTTHHLWCNTSCELGHMISMNTQN